MRNIQSKPPQFTAVRIDKTTNVGRKPETTDVEFIRAMVLSPDPIATSTELAETFDMSQQGVYSRLDGLEDRGLVRSKKVGAAAKVWWATDQGKQILRDEQRDASAEGA